MSEFKYDVLLKNQTTDQLLINAVTVHVPASLIHISSNPTYQDLDIRMFGEDDLGLFCRLLLGPQILEETVKAFLNIDQEVWPLIASDQRHHSKRSAEARRATDTPAPDLGATR